MTYIKVSVLHFAMIFLAPPRRRAAFFFTESADKMAHREEAGAFGHFLILQVWLLHHHALGKLYAQSRNPVAEVHTVDPVDIGRKIGAVGTELR